MLNWQLNWHWLPGARAAHVLREADGLVGCQVAENGTQMYSTWDTQNVGGQKMLVQYSRNMSFLWFGVPILESHLSSKELKVGDSMKPISFRVRNCLGILLPFWDFLLDLLFCPYSFVFLCSILKLKPAIETVFATLWSSNFSFSIVFATFWCSNCAYCMVFCN